MGKPAMMSIIVTVIAGFIITNRENQWKWCVSSNHSKQKGIFKSDKYFHV